MNRIKRILCALLSVCLISMPFALSVTSTGAESIDSLQQQLKELEEQNQQYQAELEKAQSDIKEKEKYNETLVSKIEVLNKKITLTRESINSLNKDIDAKRAEIDKANANIDSQLDTLAERLRTIYMAGNASELEIIFGAKDFSDFIDKVSIVKAVSKSDKELIDEIKVKLAEITKQKKSLEEDKTKLEEQQTSLQADMDEFNELLEENKETLANLYQRSAGVKDALQQAALESDEIEGMIADYYKKQQQLAAANSQTNNNSGSSNNSSNNNSNSSNNNSSSNNTPSQPSTPTVTPPTTSGYVWPCPGFYYLSSPFGDTEDRGYNHGGIDIAGGGIMGTPTLAADGGTVVAVYNGCYHNWGKYGSCGCGGGYGNYVFIDHGNGKMTIYGHLSSAIVSYGQTVSKGQTIGYVGSTGNSTGPHLHFECRYNGVKYNPMSEY